MKEPPDSLPVATSKEIKMFYYNVIFNVKMPVTTRYDVDAHRLSTLPGVFGLKQYPESVNNLKIGAWYKKSHRNSIELRANRYP